MHFNRQDGDPPFDGSRDHRDIRTFYTSELDYLRAMRKRYSCAYCGTATTQCGSCADLDRRILHLASMRDPAPL